MAVDYGRDISGSVDLSPTLQESTGDQLMREVCVRRLYTPNCSLLSSPDETTCDLREFLSTEQPLAANALTTIRGTAMSALLADPRIMNGTKVSFPIWLPEQGYLEIAIDGLGAAGPFKLTLAVTRDNISVLSNS